MIRFVLLLLITYVRCESDVDSVTTVLPNYSANQVEDDLSGSVDQIEAKVQKNVSPAVESINAINSVRIIEEIPSNEPKVEVVSNAQEVNQVHIDLNSKENLEISTEPAENEITTINPTVTRIKRAPRYTVRELMAPFGIMHEVNHIRDHVVNGVAKRIGARRLETESKARTEIHHKYHHIPNHMAYLPVVGPLFDENRPRIFSRRRRTTVRRPFSRLRRLVTAIRRRRLLRRRLN